MSRSLPAAPRPAPIRTPDQLQQSRRPDARELRAAPGAARQDAEQPLGGVLLQLQSERAHG